MSKTVCFDFDGVLAAYDTWKDGEIGDPLIEGIRLARICRQHGFKIVINTCRTHPTHGAGNQKDQFNRISDWLQENKVPYDYIEMYGKPIADYYIDDRGIRFDQKYGNFDGYAGFLFDKWMNEIQIKGGKVEDLDPELKSILNKEVGSK